LECFLHHRYYPQQIADIAFIAQEYKLQHPGYLRIMHQEILVVCSRWAYKIGMASRDYFREMGTPYGDSEREVAFDGATVVLFAAEDFMRNREGFFRVLLG
jgi:hypothetical protein